MTEVNGESSTIIVSDEEIRRVIEAILLISDTPMDPLTVAATLGFTTESVERAIEALKAEMVSRGSGIEPGDGASTRLQTLRPGSKSLSETGKCPD
jgi:chromosome segregation and condensation protein ScpB